MFRIFLIAFFYLGLISCTSLKSIPGQKGIAYIRFGSGGGFTGAEKAFYLLENGSIWEETTHGPQKKGQAGKEETAQMFDIPKRIERVRSSYNIPGNRYFFIEYKIGESSQKIVWGGDKDFPPVFEIWLKNLMNLVKKSNSHGRNLVE